LLPPSLFGRTKTLLMRFGLFSSDAVSPHLPRLKYHVHMDTSGTPTNKLDPLAKKVWRIHEGISFGIALLVCAGLAIVMALVDGPIIVWVLPLIATVVATIVWMTLVVEIMYRRWRWGVTDVEVRLQSGLIIITRTVIPMARIQHVDTSQGPILRFFGLSEVRFSTAAGKHKIPMLADADAADIRDRIAATAQVTDDGGL
jgi:membrane protein YdbS with pleckstrin-like domain